ncbi:MAG: gas vesicle protein GvpN [Candidatus Binatia bacterium]
MGVESEATPMLIAKDQPNFVETPQVREMTKRALLYLSTGYSVHFMGPSGTGKTTLALYVAGQIGRPVILIHGDEEYGTSDLVGGQYGFRRKKVVDNFIQTVLKTDEDVSMRWTDNRLTVACRYGLTLLYDEFTRSRPEANNVLLSVLEEKILDLPAGRGEDSHLRAHPDFTAIFTSNPEEYAGVYKAQDALMDRMITLRLGHYDRETEIAITQAKSGVSRSEATAIVDIVRGSRETRENGAHPTVRACVMIGKVVKQAGARVMAADETFVEACLDILNPTTLTAAPGTEEREGQEMVLSLIKNNC